MRGHFNILISTRRAGIGPLSAPPQEKPSIIHRRPFIRITIAYLLMSLSTHIHTYRYIHRSSDTYCYSRITHLLNAGILPVVRHVLSRHLPSNSATVALYHPTVGQLTLHFVPPQPCAPPTNKQSSPFLPRAHSSLTLFLLCRVASVSVPLR